MEMYLVIRYLQEKKKFFTFKLFGLYVKNAGDPYSPISITIFFLLLIYMILNDDNCE